MKRFIPLFCFIIFLAACSDVSKINADDASEVIKDYLAVNQEYKTTRFEFGEMKFNSKKDMLLLEKYKDLESDGYISMELESGKKKFLSSDSSFVYRIKLTQKASELVIKQDEDKATVKAVLYELTDEKPVNFNQVNDNHAKVTVTLKKENTVFAPFQKNDDNYSEFITRTYRLKLDKESGWKVVK